MQHLLEMHGIACRIDGEFRLVAAGGIPPVETWPGLWVDDPADVEEAQCLVEEALEPPELPQHEWTCPNCRESNDAQFGACWNCGADSPVESGA